VWKLAFGEGRLGLAKLLLVFLFLREQRDFIHHYQQSLQTLQQQHSQFLARHTPTRDCFGRKTY
jgi:hypothetical protein